MSDYMLIRGDARAIPLNDKSIHCACMSPPFFGLRDYGDSRQIGLEPTPAEFVRAIVAVMREVWRVLRDDGVCWVNLGDSMCSSSASESTMELRDDLTPDELAYVLNELARHTISPVR